MGHGYGGEEDMEGKTRRVPGVGGMVRANPGVGHAVLSEKREPQPGPTQRVPPAPGQRGGTRAQKDTGSSAEARRGGREYGVGEIQGPQIGDVCSQ